VACDVALGEALISTRFAHLARTLDAAHEHIEKGTLERFELLFRKQQFLAQLAMLADVIRSYIPSRQRTETPGRMVDEIFAAMERESDEMFRPGVSRKSDFFRDLAGSMYLRLAESLASPAMPVDRLVGLFDKAILDVENRPAGADNFGVHARAALLQLATEARALHTAIERIAGMTLEIERSVGTGYGRATLPFPKEQIRSEILCHGLGAHYMFPNTRSVLDIGGQDTKAIQVDERGIVTSFQMNDRCAAGCGRYLGYIADEMNVGLQELGPMACQSSRPVRINSTCTVFAGAELRERLSLGEKREDILAGLHRAIILRAMSLLARSGGVTNEFTFTGGVARNPAAVNALRELVGENYGAIAMNISTDSIYTGALGAALFAHRNTASTDAAKLKEAA
jgi:benzoyl-CoA reductase subunit A